MDSLDEALAEIADRHRPSAQPPLDDLVARARRRRGRTAVVATLAGIGVVTVGLLQQLSGPATKQDVVRPLGPTGTPVATATCRFVTSNHTIYDYVDFVRVGGVTLTHGVGADPYPTLHPEDLAGVVGTVRCRLNDTNGRAKPDHLQDETSSYLSVGTPLYAVKGYDPACRIAARLDGKLKAYLALDDTATTATAKQCAVGPPRGAVVGGLQTIGGPGGNAGGKVAGTVVFTSTAGKTTSVVVGKSGFRVWLEPGQYDVTGTSAHYNDGKGTCRALKRVTVVAGAQATVEVLCLLP
jgi:hypothetical protein